MKNYYILKRNVGITKCPDCSKRGIATHAVNVGLLCGQGCLHCSSPSRVFRHEIFKELNVSAFELFRNGISVLDPWTPIRVANTAYKLTKEDVVLLSNQTDPYDPNADEVSIGRRCVEAILNNSEARLKIVSKSGYIVNDIELFKKYKERVAVGFSMIAPIEKSNLSNVLEPKCERLSDKIKTFERIKEMGISVFGMVRPCFPGLISSYEDIESIFKTILKFDPESILFEPADLKWNNIISCSKEYANNGYEEICKAIILLREKKSYSNYVKNLISSITLCARKYNCIDKVKIVVNSDGDGFDVDESAVIWLKRK